jgi:excisionase family DNA binding protein
MRSGRIVLVLGPADPSLDSVLERGGLRQVMRMDEMTVWMTDGSGPSSPAKVPAHPAAPGGPERLLLTVVQAAAVLGIGRTAAYQLIRARELEVVHVGRSVRVPADALPDLVRRLRSEKAVVTAALGDPGGSSQPDDTIRSVASGDGSQQAAARTA